MLSVDDASFSCTQTGVVRIDFKDPVFARADIVFYDPSSDEVTGLVDGHHFKIGVLPKSLAGMFKKHAAVLLTAPHPNGHELVLSAHVSTLH